MRSYLRHPTSITIEIAVVGASSEAVTASNLSEGGLSFISSEPLHVGDVIDLRILTPEYLGEAVVVWQHERELNCYEVGVRFTNEDQYFRARMVEQVCQIESYRQQLAAVGRNLTSEAAAIEWIERYAGDFDEQVFEQDDVKDRKVARLY